MTPLTANILQPLIDVANGVLQFFHDSAGLSWGMSIIALTVVTRAVLIPLTYKQLKGMRAMQALQPQIKELQEKYKNDKQRMQQEMMRFYKENKVNPLASCLPLLAQLPVFITLFYVLRHELPPDMGCPEAGHCAAYGAEFLFIHDLTGKAEGGELIALLILYVGTQLASGAVMAVTADKSQRMMMFALPLIFVPFILNFPAGLILYWITTNFWTIGQQLVIKRIVPPPVVATPEGAAAIQASKPPPPPPRKKKKRR
ncbi:MAG TPA: YidC/Oxa1 family membrane protein insertase [Solirubrobacterales bacterium]|jgi:YidC/Oxa1 family membrane protein insertase|nr:YidC/Oxa1 family membrane protein insertase [Solirubrobacterales bacterium]